MKPLSIDTTDMGNIEFARLLLAGYFVGRNKCAEVAVEIVFSDILEANAFLLYYNKTILADVADEVDVTMSIMNRKRNNDRIRFCLRLFDRLFEQWGVICFGIDLGKQRILT